MANPIIKIKRGSGAPVSLQVGEVAFDTVNKSFFIGTATGVLPIGGEHIFAKKTYVDSAVSTEQVAREAADSTLTSDLNAEISRAQGAESDLADDISAEATARAAAITSEASTRASADTSLDGKISTEKGRIDAILSAVDADKDTFAEIVSLINSVDTTNDSAFAGYVLSNNAALAQEVTDRQSGDSALAADIVTVETAATALTSRVSAAETDISDEEAARIAADSTLQSNITAEASARASADTTLQSNITAEASARSTADTNLSNRIDSLETVGVSGRLTDLESDVADHESRIAALESVIDGGTY
jgi:predicted  nucleic acid-binding Zn-ribbon protein